MNKLIRSIALWVLLAPALLLSVTSANAQCAFQSITYGQTISGSLSTTDCTDNVSGASYYADNYQFTGTAGDKIAIQMSSTDFDNWLVLWFPSGNYTNNDNGGGGTNARIPATSGYYTLPESGTYLLEATSYVSNKTGSYTLSLAKEAVSGAATMDIVSGWNLLGNSSSTALNVASAFGDPSKVTTVWKWIAQKANWAFYTPTQTDGGAAYAASRGYELMTSVAGGEGFWVNAKTSFTVALPTGAAIGSEAFKNMAPGWTLIATGDNKTPSAFNNAISITAPAAGVIPTNFTSLWAWDAKLAKWYLYAPSLDQSGGLTSYITSEGYLDFGSKVLAPTAGFWVKAGDGLPKVEITNLPGATSAVVQEQKEATGEVINDKKIVSGEYLVQIKGTAPTHGNILLSIPIARSLLPAGWNQASFFPEYFDAATNTWKSTGSFLNYDIATETLSFVVNVVEADLVPAVMLSSSRRHILLTTDQTILARSYRVAATGISGNITEKQLAGSNFIIHYYEAKNLNPGAINAIPVNWNGNDVGFEAPSYIRHLDTALNNIYGKFVLLVDSKGNRLMPVVSTPQHVYVEYLNGDPGDSRIGGPLRISTRNVESVADMNGVAAHELFHVFQGYFLGTITSTFNFIRLAGMRWFLEATANYYAAVANSMNDAQKRHLYSDKYGTDYLSVPIDTNDEQNHYAVAYFLDWMSTNYGNIAIIGDVFRDYNDVTMSPLLSMDRVLKANGEPKGLSGAYDKYMANFMTHPDAFNGFNLAEKTTMQAYTKANFLSTQGLNARNTFSSLSRPLFPPLSSTYIWFNLNTPLDALLVIDSSKSERAADVVKSYTYDFTGNDNAAYQGKTAVDNGLSFPYAAKNQLTIKNFKEMEQLFVNSTALVDQKSYNLNVDYYLLVKPLVKQVQIDAVLWDSSSVGNIPAEYIKGYDVYKDVTGKYTKINSVLKGQIPFVAGGTEIALACTLRDCNDSIKPTDKIVVVIEDKYGNKWPDVTVSVPLLTITSLSPVTGPISTAVTIVGTGFGATQGTSKVTFGVTAVAVLTWSDKQITTTVPAGAAAGNVNVMVEVNSVKSNVMTFTVGANTVPVYIRFNPPEWPDKTKCFIGPYDTGHDPDGCLFESYGLVVAGVPAVNSYYYNFNAVLGQTTSVSVTAGYLDWTADRFIINGNISIPATGTAAAYWLEVNVGTGTLSLTPCQNSGCY